MTTIQAFRSHPHPDSARDARVDEVVLGLAALDGLLDDIGEHRRCRELYDTARGALEDRLEAALEAFEESGRTATEDYAAVLEHEAEDGVDALLTIAGWRAEIGETELDRIASRKFDEFLAGRGALVRERLRRAAVELRHLPDEPAGPGLSSA